jgi:hypothetical protein
VTGVQTCALPIYKTDNSEITIDAVFGKYTINNNFINWYLNYENDIKDLFIELLNISELNGISIDDNDENHTKITVYDFFSINEIKICEIIEEISYYRNYYDILTDYDFIDIGKIGEKIIENVDLDSKNKDKKYVVFNYNDEKRIGFSDFLFKSPNNNNNKQFVFNILNTYSFLLNSLIKLNENGVCFFELSTENIVFSSYSRPFLKCFKNSLIMSDLNTSYIGNIVKNIDTYTYKPLEVHVLFYLIVNNEETMSFSFIEAISNNYVKNMDVLSLFSQNYKESFDKSFVET